MFDRIRRLVLRAMRVPAEPVPPAGAPGTVRVFRAGQSFYKLRLLGWVIGQIGATIGLAFSIGFFMWFKTDVENGWRAEELRAKAAATAPAVPVAPAPETVSPVDSTENVSKPAKKKKRADRNDLTRQIAKRMPRWGLTVLQVVEAGAILVFLVQIPVTYAAVRLDFELRWYIVTDRSLRIRTGLLAMQESTMSFANLQQVSVSQGPLQRLLGIADVQVQSAGGGGGGEKGHQHDDSLHTGVFHGVENANEVRDLILQRLRLFRQSGIGDPDDVHDQTEVAATAPAIGAGAATDVLAAARELLAETRALRAALS